MTDHEFAARDWQTEKTRRLFGGLIVGLAVFWVVGTVTSVWSNPYFTRMTPVGPWEMSATALMGVLSGVSAGFWTKTCRIGQPGGGGLASFLGIACPTCNKLLMFVFGAPALMAWFNPLRPYLALLGLVGLAWSAWSSVRAFHWQNRDRPKGGRRFSGVPE